MSKDEVINLVSSTHPIVRLAENSGCAVDVYASPLHLANGYKTYAGEIVVGGENMLLFRLSISEQDIETTWLYDDGLWHYS